jgi:hypothetical protein
VTLREFGIVGGDATAQANTGVLINHVIHRRVDLDKGQKLSRQLRFSFGRASDRRWLDVPPHWLSESEPKVVGGVGDAYAQALANQGLATLEKLAESDPQPAGGTIPRTLLVEFRSKARLALRTAAEIHPPEALHDLTAGKVLTTPSSDLAHDAGVVETEVIRLREQLATLELALDHRFLRGVTVQALAGGDP